MNKLKKLALLPILLIAAVLLTAIPASAGSLLTDGVSILNPKQNIHGDGYEWHNPSDTLTLTNLNIRTEDDYGLKIPDGATVILEGKNYIKASKAALYIGGDVIIRGNGSLTLEGGEYGILVNSTKNTHKLSITAGTYTITGGVDGIHSDMAKVALSGGKLTITGGSGYAINARELLTSAGVTVTAKGSLYSSYNMLLQATNLTVESDKQALIADKYIKLESMTLKGGESLSSLSDISEYTDQKALSTVSTLDTGIKSILFGAPYSIAIDIVLLVLLLLVLAAVIVIPKLVHQHKAQKLIMQNEAAEAEAKRQKKLQKKGEKAET